MLMWPKYNTPFKPTLFYWLGGISIFDREETLGAMLWLYDPNNQSDREEIIKKYILSRFDYLTYRHRFVLFSILQDAFKLPDFNFSIFFESDDDENYYLAWDETEIVDHRLFFEDIRRLAGVKWKNDLEQAGLEDQRDW